MLISSDAILAPKPAQIRTVHQNLSHSLVKGQHVERKKLVDEFVHDACIATLNTFVDDFVDEFVDDFVDEFIDDFVEFVDEFVDEKKIVDDARIATFNAFVDECGVSCVCAAYTSPSARRRLGAERLVGCR